MAKATHKYTLLRYIIDAPVVMASFFISLWILDLHRGHFYSLALILFALLSVTTWYVAGSFSRLYAERRSNKFSEEIVFILQVELWVLLSQHQKKTAGKGYNKIHI